MKDNIDRLLKNYLNTKKSWESWCFMVSSGELDFHTGQYDYDKSIRKKVDENPLLFYLRYLAFKDYHIEVYKILKNTSNNKDNVFNLLNTFLKERPDLEKEITACLKKFEDLKSEIKKMTDVRDKFYAHLDSDYEKYIFNNSGLEEYNKTFIAIETAIILLTSKERFQKLLDETPFRYDFNLT